MNILLQIVNAIFEKFRDPIDPRSLGVKSRKSLAESKDLLQRMAFVNLMVQFYLTITTLLFLPLGTREEAFYYMFSSMTSFVLILFGMRNYLKTRKLIYKIDKRRKVTRYGP